MRIVCISTSRIPSDTANSIQVMKACQGLARLGHNVDLVVPGEERTDWNALAERYGLSKPFDIHWLPGNPRWKHNDFAWNAARCARRLNASLVYTWTGQSAVFSLMSQIPVIYEVHDMPTGKLGPNWFRAFLRGGGKKRLVPITRALFNKLEQAYGRIPESMVVIAPNGVDLEQYEHLPGPAEARAMLGLPPRMTVLCAGHLYAGRGVELFTALAKGFPKVSFVWVGGRPEDLERVRASAAQEGIQNLTLTGFVSQRRLPEYQAAADVLLMPYAYSIAGSSGGNSAEICSPMKMFDYLAAGRAILSSDLPVIHEVLNTRNAVFAVPEDVASWSAKLDRLLSDASLREAIALQGRIDALSYSWKARAQRALDGFPN